MHLNADGVLVDCEINKAVLVVLAIRIWLAFRGDTTTPTSDQPRNAEVLHWISCSITGQVQLLYMGVAGNQEIKPCLICIKLIPEILLPNWRIVGYYNLPVRTGSCKASLQPFSSIIPKLIKEINAVVLVA